MATPAQTIRFSGFDPDGEPQIQVMPDNSLRLKFEFMPPMWGEDKPELFDHFDKRLQEAIGVPVQWEDREVFLIRNPAPDTVERITAFLETVVP